MPISPETYERVALEDTDHTWELVCGRLRRKPDMTTEHNQAARTLAVLLGRQLDLREFTVGTESGRLRISTGTYYVPDLCVIPVAMVRRLHQRPGTFEVYDDPVPLVVEVWSPSTGEYDVEDKLREHQWRNDSEIWRIFWTWGTRTVPQPPPDGAPPRYPTAERTVTTWCRQPDGTYVETVHRGGVLRPVALPGVTIDFDTLFMI